MSNTTTCFRIIWQKQPNSYTASFWVVCKRSYTPPLRRIGSGWNNLGVRQLGAGERRAREAERSGGGRRWSLGEHGGDRTPALRLPGSAHRGRQRRRLPARIANARVRESVKHDTCVFTVVSWWSFPPNDSRLGWVCARTDKRDVFDGTKVKHNNHWRAQLRLNDIVLESRLLV